MCTAIHRNINYCFVLVLEKLITMAPTETLTNAPAALNDDMRTHCLIESDARVVYPLARDVELLSSKCGLDSHGNLDLRTLNDTILHSTIIWKSIGAALLKLTDKVALKFNSSIDVGHVSMLDHIHAHAPGLPIPHALGMVASPSRKHLFMTYFSGDTLEARWPHLCAEQKRSVRDQLNNVFSALRMLPPPASSDERVPFGGGIPARCKDNRRANPRVADRLITDEQQFNVFLTTEKNRTQNAWITKIRAQLREDHKCVMTHGDLHAGNVIVRMCDENVLLVGVVDWETCGWYPEYWEYVKALFTMPYKGSLSDWWEYLPPAIGVWPHEYAIDLLITRWHG